MKKVIMDKLHEIEKEHNIKIIMAVSAGSRAKGLSSLDSDYDVRFIYVKDLKEYLSINENKDSISFIEGAFDYQGWDIKKALTLANKSNMNLLEYFNEDVYKYIWSNTAKDLEVVVKNHFNRLRGIYHYLNLSIKALTVVENIDCDGAKRLSKETMVKLYVNLIYPVFACSFLLNNEGINPVLFEKLYQSEKESMCKDDKFKKAVDWFISMKKKGKLYISNTSNLVFNQNLYLYGNRIKDVCSKKIDEFEKTINDKKNSFLSSENSEKTSVEDLNNLFFNAVTEKGIIINYHILPISE